MEGADEDRKKGRGGRNGYESWLTLYARLIYRSPPAHFLYRIFPPFDPLLPAFLSFSYYIATPLSVGSTSFLPFLSVFNRCEDYALLALFTTSFIFIFRQSPKFYLRILSPIHPNLAKKRSHVSLRKMAPPQK